MQHLTIKALLLWLVMTLCSMSSYAADTKAVSSIKQIVFFGDSLSDNGNLYHYDIGTLPKSPPYYEGRFSNGPTWAELVANHFKAVNNISSENYAIGGETILYHDPNKGYWPFMLDQSLLDYFAHNLETDKTDTLFVVLIGANDYLWGSEDPEKDTSAVTNALEDNLKLLIKAGGRHFLLLNLPDLSVVPAAKMGGDIETLHKLTELHNEKLARMAEYLQANNAVVEIKIFDYNALSADLLAHPATYNIKYNTHISNVSDACWTGGYQLMATPNQEAKMAANLAAAFQANPRKMALAKPLSYSDIVAMAHTINLNPALSTAFHINELVKSGLKPCQDPGAHVFWDLVHPTADSHAITSAVVIDYIEKNFFE